MFTYLRKLIIHSKKKFALTSLLLFALTGTATFALTSNDAISQKLADPQQSQYGQLKKNASNFFGSVNEAFSVPNFLYGEPLFKPNNSSDSYEQTINNFFQTYPDLFQTKISDFRVEVEKPKNRNITQVHLFQKYKNVPVFGGEVIFTFNDNNELVSYLGKYVPRVSIDIKPKTTPKEIKNIVARDLKVDTVTQEPRLFVFNKGVLIDTKESTQLVWRLGTNGWVYFVNANNKEVVYKYEDVDSALSREVYSAGGGTPTLPGTSEITEGDDTSTIPPGDALNAYNYSEDVYNYYYNNFGLDSYDGTGSTMVSTVDYDTSNFAIWCNYLKSQDVDDCPGFQGVLFYAGYTVLDITAHEWAHAVDDYAVIDEASELYGLTMADQSGALNESYSDIFGVLIEEEYGSELDWDIGEDSPSGMFRNLADPTTSRTSQPDDWSGYDSSQDSHYNSGIPNKAAYLIMREASEGYERFNSVDVRGMGTDMAEEIFYYALRDELLISATFEDNLNALLATCYTLETIDIDTADCESIYDAYTAIGVADGTVTFVEANINTDTTSGYGPLTVSFNGTDSVSFGRNITSYAWDFGDGDTDSGDTVSHTYDPGSYTATLTITDSDGQTDSETVSIEVTNPIDATFSQTGDGTAAPATVSFDASATTDHTGTIIDYSWDFGDGTTASTGTTATTTHTYSNPGSYPVTLTVTDDYGYTETAEATAVIYASGTISTDTTWSADYSPYVISGGVTVSSGYALTIEPGTVVKFLNTSSYLTVNGTLDAQGTSTDSIVFTSYQDDDNGGDTNGDGTTTTPAAGDWILINFASGSVSTLGYTTIQYGGYEGSSVSRSYSMVKISSDSVTISNSTLTDSEYNVIEISSSSPIVTDSTISRSATGRDGVYISGGAAFLERNTVSDNYYGVVITSGTATLSNNTITNNTLYGVSVSGSATLEGNTISNNYYGVSISGTPTLLNNTITSNTVYGIQGSSTSGTFQGNTISDNYYGIYITSSSSPIIDENTIDNNSYYGLYISSSGTPTVTNNTFTNNSSYNSNAFRVNNVTSGTIITGNTGSDNNYNAIILSGSTNGDFELNMNNDLLYMPFVLTVSSGDTLTVTPGTTVKIYPDGGYMTINGTLDAQGTTADPIVFTSYYDDAYGGDTNGDGSATTPTAGDWRYMKFASGSTGTLTNAIIQYGGSHGYSTNYGMLYLGSDTITVTDCTLSNTTYYALEIASSSPTVSNSAISDSIYGALYINGGSPTLTSNTITNSTYGIYAINSASPTVINNLIYDNSSYGLYNTSTTTITAESNWWGDASGPYNATSNPTGTGDTVGSYVDFDPWTTTDPTADVTPPSDVTLGTNRKDVWAQTITLNWTNPTDSDFDHVQIDRTDVLAGTTTTLSSSETGTSYADTTPSYNTTYTYTLYAVDTTGNVSTGVTTSNQRLRNPAPTNLVLTAGDTSIAAAWNASSAPASTIGGYIVYYGTSRTALTNSVDVGNVTSTTLTGLTNYTRYFVAVTAYSKGGHESAQSGIRATRPHP